MAREVVQPQWLNDGCSYCQDVQPGGRTGARLPRSLVVAQGTILHWRRVPAFLMDSRRHLKLSNTDAVPWEALVDGFEAAYVDDPRRPQGGGPTSSAR